MSNYIIRKDSYLAHYGVQGMRWGVRNYQNADGSLNAAGRQRYNIGKYAGKVRNRNMIYQSTNSKLRSGDNTSFYKKGSFLSGKAALAEKIRIKSQLQKDIKTARASRDISQKEYISRLKRSGKDADKIVRSELGNKSVNAIPKFVAGYSAAALTAAAITAFAAYQIYKS